MTLDIVTFTVTAPGVVGVAAAPVAGDSAFVRSTPTEIGGVLVGVWTKAQAVGFSQLVFPYGHDVARNIRYRNLANSPVNAIPLSAKQPMKSQDLMSVTQAGSAVGGDVELICAQVAYPDLPGGSDKFIGSDELASRTEELVTIEDTTTAAAASTYGGARAFNQVTTSLKANRNYAVLGAFIAVACGALTIRGQDTGNLRCAIPGNATLLNETRDYFVRLSDWWQMPLIPVINAANQGGTFIENITDENLTAVPFSLMLALLTE